MSKFSKRVFNKIKLSNILTALFIVLTMSVPALAHVVTANWPRITFSVDSKYELGSIVTVEADTQNATSVSWRLLCNGQGVPIHMSENGGSFVIDKAGNYILRGAARNGNILTTHTARFNVRQSGSSGSTSEFSIKVGNTIYSESGKIQVSATAYNISSANWMLIKNGTPVEPAPELGVFGGSFRPSGAGKYQLIATAHAADGEIFTETASFVVKSDPTITLNMPIKASVNTPVEIRLDSSGIQPDSIKVILRKDDSETVLSGFSDTGGTAIFPDIGLYEIEVTGYDAAHQVLASDTNQILIMETVEEEPLAGASLSRINQRSIYEWREEYIMPQYESIVHIVMEALECDTIYQSISDQETDVILDFLSRRQEDGHRVYYLCGNSSWATEEDAASMMAELNKVIAWNEVAEKAGTAKFYGIQYDIESLNKEEKMDQVVENYKAVYQVAKQHDIKVMACIAYYLDTEYGFISQLEDLIANGCDSVAIMNYYKQNSEADNIETEVALCKKYEKELVNITEMQPIGSHGLTEDNTYHDDGINAVEKMWKKLDATFDYDIGFSYHYMKPVEDLLGLES